jgi:hypothetical protein
LARHADHLCAAPQQALRMDRKFNDALICAHLQCSAKVRISQRHITGCAGKKQRSNGSRGETVGQHVYTNEVAAVIPANCYDSNYNAIRYALNLRMGNGRTTYACPPHVALSDTQMASLRSGMTQLKAMG